MSKYKIVRWDAILAQNGLNKIPMIYIEPDIDFLEFAKNNDDQVIVKISDTNSIYDGKEILGSINRSSFMPNFFNETKLYVVTLQCIWMGYPESLGNASFYGLRA